MCSMDPIISHFLTTFLLLLLSSSHFGAYHGNCYNQLMVDFMSILVTRILKTLLIICAMMDSPDDLFVLVKRS